MDSSTFVENPTTERRESLPGGRRPEGRPSKWSGYRFFSSACRVAGKTSILPRRRWSLSIPLPGNILASSPVIAGGSGCQLWRNVMNGVRLCRTAAPRPAQPAGRISLFFRTIHALAENTGTWPRKSGFSPAFPPGRRGYPLVCYKQSPRPDVGRGLCLSLGSAHQPYPSAFSQRRKTMPMFSATPRASKRRA